MRTPKLLKPQQKALALSIHSLLVEVLHASITLNGLYQYHLEATKGGPVNLSIDLDSKYPSLYLQFFNPTQAKSFLDCNPHSGKHNLHAPVYESDTDLTMLTRFYYHLRPVLDTQQRLKAEQCLINKGCDL